MAITITQQPTSPNAAYTRLLNVVSGSTNTGNPQYSYMMDVYESGSSDKIVRIIQGINPAGVSVFDPSRIIQGQLAEDQSWKISSVTPFESGSKLFTLKFGEQYGTSDSSSITEYPDLAENVIEVFRGVVEPNDGSYNWPSSSYAVLSNMPSTMSMQFDDYGTISVYNSDNAYVSQSFYSASATGIELVQQKNYDLTDTFSSVPISASTPYWNYVEVNTSSSLGIQSYKYEVSDETHREKVRFAFINKLGAWDYFNNYNPVQQTTAVNREQYTANRVDYSSLTSTYDITRRGLSDFHTSVDDSFTVQTDYLDKTNANWLEELIESPSVFIQRNGEFIPIVILNSSYTANTNQARQKLFQYTLEFIPSNQPFGTWIPEYVTCPKQQPKPPYVITEEFTNVSYLGFDLNGSVITDGGATVVERGFAYSSQSSNPSITGSTSVKVTSGTGEGDFSSIIVSASVETTYYARAYASNSMALVYGDIKQANTLPFDLPQVSTQAITGIESGSLTFNGTSISQGGDPSAQFGFVYNTGSDPVITDNILTVPGPLGTYSGSVSGLVENVPYYARAYASNSAYLVYGDEVTATIVGPLLLSTEPASSFTTQSFVINGNISSIPPGEPVTDRGFVYSTSSLLPDISSSNSTTVQVGSGSGSFSYLISDSTQVDYYYRAYASSSAELKYGDVETAKVLTAFNPYAGGIATSSLTYWFDFTDSNSMSISNGDNVNGITSKGSSSISLASGSDIATFTPPTYKTHYTQFTTDGGTKHGKLSSMFGNVTGHLNGFESSSVSTAIIFAKIDNWQAGQLQDNLIEYAEGNESLPFNPPKSFNSYTIWGTRNGNPPPGSNFTNEPISSNSSVNKASGVEINTGVEFEYAASDGIYYSYEGTTPYSTWESRFVRYTPAGGATGSLTSGRTPSETVRSTGNEPLWLGGIGGHYLTVGGDSAGGSAVTNPFSISHFLFYTGSLTNDQITAVINSFTGSVPFGNELNSITN